MQSTTPANTTDTFSAAARRAQLAAHLVRGVPLCGALDSACQSSHHLRNGCRGFLEGARGHANKVGARGRVGLQVLSVVGWFDCRVHPSKRFVSLHVENSFAQWEPRPSSKLNRGGGVRRFWSMFLLTRAPFRVPFFSATANCGGGGAGPL